MITFSETLETHVENWRKQKKRLILVTGVFDLLHIEHVRFLTQAKALGDVLIVGIETDERVRQIKGPNRPIHPLSIRAEQLKSLKSVDIVFKLPQKFDNMDAWLSLLEQLQPDVYAVSSNSSHLRNKQKLSDQAHVAFQIIPATNPSVSTSTIEKKLLELE